MKQQKKAVRLVMCGIVAVIGIASLMLSDRFSATRRELITVQINYGKEDIVLVEQPTTSVDENAFQTVVDASVAQKDAIVQIDAGESVNIDIRGITPQEIQLVSYELLADGTMLLVDGNTDKKHVPIEKQKSKRYFVMGESVSELTGYQLMLKTKNTQKVYNFVVKNR